MENIKQFIKDYPNTTNKELSKKYNISYSKVIRLGMKYSLVKSKKHLTKISIQSNINKGFRDLNFENLKKIASKYKTKYQFQLDDPSAYNTARKKGFLNEICQHMIPSSYSIPQLILKYIMDEVLDIKCSYNNRTIIAPYELDLYYEKYNLGFEYDGKKWHVNNNNDLIKEKLCISNNITLITIIENNRRYEEDIKNQIINNLSIINKITNKNILEKEILDIKIDYIKLFENVLDLDDIKKTISKYEYLNDFRKNENKLYSKLSKMNLLDLIDLKKERGGYTIDDIKKIINKYEYLDDFANENPKYYLWVNRHNKSLLNNLKYQNGLKYDEIDVEYSIEYLIKTVPNCKSIADIRREMDIIYRRYKEKNKFNIIIDFLKNNNYNKYFNYYEDDIDFEKIEKICKQYNKIGDFRKKYDNIYNYLLKNKLIEKYFSHIKTLNNRFGCDIEEIKKIIEKYEFIHNLVEENEKVYNWAMKNDKSLLSKLKYKNGKPFKY